MAGNTSKSHDAFFRKMMSNVETVRDFLCAHLSAMLCDLCDFD
ncbi:MAG: Rpn family recombination-promoting nuclease/putative transposase, partial [Candidatus Accumulibacter sp.]|nr:Rpn family recombination-promoting nuclease/putative transposase [Accumulibacter sp.]